MRQPRPATTWYADGAYQHSPGAERNRLGREHAERAIALFAASGNRSGEAGNLAILAYHCAALGDNVAAIDYGQRAVELSRTSLERGKLAYALGELAFVYRSAGDFRQAVTCLEEATAATDTSPHVHAELLVELGDCRRDAGQEQAAQTAWMQALEIYEQISHPAAEELRERLATG